MQNVKQQTIYQPGAVPAVVALSLLLTASGCDLVVGIFQVGFWLGLIVLLIVVAMIAFVVRLFTRRRV